MRLRLVPVVLLAGCQLFGGGDTLSCTLEEIDGTSTRCGEWTDVLPVLVPTIEAACRLGGHTYGDGACPTEGRLGGCRQVNDEGTGTTWFYPGGEIDTLGEIAAECDEGQILVDADGNELPEGSGLCTTAGDGSILVLTFRNETAGPVSVYLRDAACVEGFETTLDPAGIEGQPSTPGEVWVVREGEADPTGTILLELVAETSDVVVID